MARAEGQFRADLEKAKAKGIFANGDPDAQLRVGIALTQGKGVQQNVDEGFEWIRKSAKQGHPDAQHKLGKFYRDVKGDKTKASKWIARAASHQNYMRSPCRFHIDAQFDLALAYFHGDGIKPDKKIAAEFCEKAAVQDHIESQFMLGCMYLEGQGKPRNYEEAYNWIRRAADKGHKEARLKLKDKTLIEYKPKKFEYYPWDRVRVRVWRNCVTDLNFVEDSKEEECHITIETFRGGEGDKGIYASMRFNRRQKIVDFYTEEATFSLLRHAIPYYLVDFYELNIDAVNDCFTALKDGKVDGMDHRTMRAIQFLGPLFMLRQGGIDFNFQTSSASESNGALLKISSGITFLAHLFLTIKGHPEHSSMMEGLHAAENLTHGHHETSHVSELRPKAICECLRLVKMREMDKTSGLRAAIRSLWLKARGGDNTGVLEHLNTGVDPNCESCKIPKGEESLEDNFTYPLLIAIKEGHTSVVKILLNHSGIEIESMLCRPNENGWYKRPFIECHLTALQMSCNLGQVEITEMLFQKHPEITRQFYPGTLFEYTVALFLGSTNHKQYGTAAVVLKHEKVNSTYKLSFYANLFLSEKKTFLGLKENKEFHEQFTKFVQQLGACCDLLIEPFKKWLIDQHGGIENNGNISGEIDSILKLMNGISKKENDQNWQNMVIISKLFAFLSERREKYENNSNVSSDLYKLYQNCFEFWKNGLKNVHSPLQNQSQDDQACDPIYNGQISLTWAAPNATSNRTNNAFGSHNTSSQARTVEATERKAETGSKPRKRLVYGSLPNSL